MMEEEEKCIFSCQSESKEKNNLKRNFLLHKQQQLKYKKKKKNLSEVFENGLLLKIPKILTITHSTSPMIQGGRDNLNESGFTFHCNIYTKFFFFNGLLTVKIGLTYAIAENNGQNHSYSNSSQGRALPGAIFR